MVCHVLPCRYQLPVIQFLSISRIETCRENGFAAASIVIVGGTEEIIPRGIKVVQLNNDDFIATVTTYDRE